MRKAAVGEDSWTRARGAGVGLAVALLVVSFAGYYRGLFSPHVLPRQVALLPLTFALAAVCVVALRTGRRPVMFDLVDLLAGLLAIWVVVGALLSSAEWVSWLGYYNRGTGALFVLGELTLFVTARRLLVARRCVIAIVWAISALLVLLALVAIVQALGGQIYWAVVGQWHGRWTGTTGNPLTIAGLSLLGLWLFGLLVSDGIRGSLQRAPRGSQAAECLSRAARWAAGIGVAAGLTANLLAVTRASYLAWTSGLVLVIAWLIRRRRHRMLAVALALLVVVGVSAMFPVSDGRGGAISLFGRVDAARATVGQVGSSDSRRLDLWRTGIKAVAARPVAGFGSGAYIVADRLFRPTSLRDRVPERFSSDPHSLPLLVGSQTGIVGVLLFGGLCVFIGVGLWRLALALTALQASAGKASRPNAKSSSKGRHPTWKPCGETPSFASAGAFAAAVFLTAAGVFLLFGPLDIAFAVPMVLIAGLALPVTPTTGLGARMLPAFSRPAVARGAWIATTAVLCLGVAVTAVFGAQYLRADRALAEFARSGSLTTARRAYDLFPREPFYALEAGAATWREAASPGPDGAVEANDGTREGEALVRAGIACDPTGPLGYTDLARFHMTTGRFDLITDDVTQGLRWNPHHPVLEGLWAYAAALALSRSQRAAAAMLHDTLQEADPRSPDAWHWTSAYLTAIGDERGAKEAARKAADAAPRLTDRDYEQRLLRAR